MKRIFCDRCGIEIVKPQLMSFSQAAEYACTVEYSVTSKIPMCDVKKYDLCKDCQEELASWLNEIKVKE